MHKRNANARYRAVAIRLPRKARCLAEDDTVFGAVTVDADADVGSEVRDEVADHPVDAPPPSPAPSPQLLPLGRWAGKPAFRFTRPVALVGRRRAAHVKLTAPEISNAHAIMLHAGGRVYLRDLASRAGVRLNCLTVRRAYLEDGDHVAFGRFIFQFQAAAPAGGPLVEEAPPAAQLEAAGAPHPVPIEDPVTVIGRRAGCDLVLTEASCSTVHAVIVSMSGKRFVRDLGSRTGTFVNGHRVKQEELHLGDVILVGETELRYVAAASPAVTPGGPSGPPEAIEAEPSPVVAAEPAAVPEPLPAPQADLPAAEVAEPGAMLGLVSLQEGDEEVLADLIGALAEMPEPEAAAEAAAEAATEIVLWAPPEMGEFSEVSVAETAAVELSAETQLFCATADCAEPVGPNPFDDPGGSPDVAASALSGSANGDAHAGTDGAAVAVASDVSAAGPAGGEEGPREHFGCGVVTAGEAERKDVSSAATWEGPARANGRSGRWFSFLKRAKPGQPAESPRGDVYDAPDEALPLWDLADPVSADERAEKGGRVDPAPVTQTPGPPAANEGLISHGVRGLSAASGRGTGEGDASMSAGW